MIVLVIFLILLLLMIPLYIARRVTKQEKHLDKLKHTMNDRLAKEAKQSRLAKERTISA